MENRVKKRDRGYKGLFGVKMKKNEKDIAITIKKRNTRKKKHGK